MLSHHELAKLLLIDHAPEAVVLGHPDVDALLQKSLIELRSRPGDAPVPRVTGEGVAILRSLGRAGRRAAPAQGAPLS